MLRHVIPLAAVCALSSGAAAEVARPPGVATHALVVGSNVGGPGQAELRWAEEDARRVGALLTELGGHAPDTVEVVVKPTPALLRERLAALGARVQADVAAGRQARVFFYYSGHARATAIDLGPEALPLAELRQRLFAVPATLTVVVLDACQSGAFSRVKGATPAADFSFNSRNQLGASGVAVLASSSGSELSQESEQLRSSYFTHHLLVALRGAGDANGDGAVSVDEAYRYAYHQTLIATATTAVGRQHVSLEVDLKGHGEVALSFPRAATAAIELPAQLEGATLVRDRRANAVVAETYKAAGAAVRIAVAPGDYELIVRRSDRMLRCQVSAGEAALRGAVGDRQERATVDLARCASEPLAAATRKGGALARPTRLEVTATIGLEAIDDFVGTLEDFGFRERSLVPLTTGIGATALRRIDALLWVGGAIAYAQSPVWERETELHPLEFEWTTTTAMAALRVIKPAARSGWRSYLGGYVQLAAGLAIGRTRFIDQSGAETRETFFGPALSVGLGGYFDVPWIRGLALALGSEFGYAPAIENQLGDTHASGCRPVCPSLGISYRY